MKRFLLCCVLASVSCACAETVLYVAKDGNDIWSGKILLPTAKKSDGPFATLARARDEVRKMKAAGTLKEAVTVYVRGGVYELPETLKLDVRDSGTAEAPVVYRAFRQEKPVLTGASAITKFEPHEGKIVKAETGVQGFGGIYFRHLFFNSKRQNLARYPNFDAGNPYGGGWAYADGKPIAMYQNVEGEDRRTLQYKQQDARVWAQADEGEVFVFPRYNWWNNIVRIKTLNRLDRKITLAGDCSYPIRPGDRYYVQNLLEELDTPGEWYLDKKSGTLYFWPPEDMTPSAVKVYAPRLRTILELGKDTAHVTFRGFTFEFFGGTAITLNGTTRCLLAGNTIRNGGDYTGSGVSVVGGKDNGVAGNDIYEIGSHGVALSGGDRITLTSAGNYADNNYIHHVGVFYKQGVGVQMHGVGNRASHNLIHDTPRMAIMFSGNNLVLEYNHMRHINLETADTGAVYTGGRDWISSRGTAIRYNYMHDSLGYGLENGKWASPHYSWGVYLDDNTGGVDVIGNIVVRASRGLIHLHNGRDNLIENNIFVNGKLQQAEFNGWTPEHRYWTSHLPTMIAGYNSVKDQPAWKGMRNMQTAPEQAVMKDGLIMSGNVFRRNIVAYREPKSKLFGSRNLSLEKNQWDENLYWHNGLPLSVARGGKLGEVDLSDWRGLGQDKRSLVADPLFVNWDKDDYRLRSNSPAFKLGFQAIPVDKIGPYKSDLRASWPIVEAEGAREKPLVP